jgi:hypothetical protein
MVLDQVILRKYIFPLGIIIERMVYIHLSVKHTMTDVPISGSSSKEM